MKFLFMLSALVLSACVTDGANGPTSYEAVGDEGYRNYTLKWNGSSAGTQTDVYYRIHNDAYFELRNEKVISTRFLNPQPEFYNSKAACVTTTTKHNKFVAIAFKIKGNNVKVFF